MVVEITICLNNYISSANISKSKHSNTFELLPITNILHLYLFIFSLVSYIFVDLTTNLNKCTLHNYKNEMYFLNKKYILCH